MVAVRSVSLFVVISIAGTGCADISVGQLRESGSQTVLQEHRTIQDFEGYAAGTTVSDHFPDFNVVAVNPTKSFDEAVIFDSAHPTGGDTDLITPGYGAGNTVARGSILVVAENITDADGDGLVDSPDDEYQGGSIEFRFAIPVRLNGLGVLDVSLDCDKTKKNTVRILDALNQDLVPSIVLPSLGDNGHQDVPTAIDGVSRVIVTFVDGGAVTYIDYSVFEEVIIEAPQVCRPILDDPATITFNDDPKPDSFKFHGRIQPEEGLLDIGTTGFSLTLDDADGVIFSRSVAGSDFVRKGKNWTFKTSGDLGLLKVSAKDRLDDGVPGHALKVQAAEDLSGADNPNIHLRIDIGGSCFENNAAWTQTARGWSLTHF